MKYQIKHRWTGDVMYEAEAESYAACVKMALKSGANLSGADLSGADLSGANLSGANLSEANLYRANLSEANLYRADLSGADLSGANLYRADLSGANLSGANLSEANLYRADLSGADLSGANLYRADLSGANLSGANLSGANLYRADLSGANLYRTDLSGANLSGANLYRADLSGANLYRADLSGANLSGANLYRAKGHNPNATDMLRILLHQTGPIRAFKLVNSKNEGPYNGGITYEVGETPEVKGADTNPANQCAPGINVADLTWCIREWKEGYKILLVEFQPEDIACIPHATDGKFRLHRCTVVKEMDLKELGVSVEPETEEGAS